MIPYLVSLLTLYLIIINAVGLALMLADKRAARKSAWRIPESTLLGIAIVGGCLGIFLGMRLFRHKTRKPRFCIGVPLILAVYALAILWLIRNYPA